MEHRTIATIGHSTHPIEEFLELLSMHAIQLLVDVRTIPRSRAHPQFSSDQLPGALQRAGIDYLHLEALGGLRHPVKDSPNTGWRNASFRGFADSMATPAFRAGLTELEERALRQRTAIMCAEALRLSLPPFPDRRCAHHRRLACLSYHEQAQHQGAYVDLVSAGGRRNAHLSR